MLTKLKSYSVIGMLLFGLLACTDSKKPEKAKQADTSAPISVSTRLKWVPGSLYLGSIAAKAKGFWAAEGLNVKIEPGGFEADPIKLVAAGSNDFGITGGEQLLQARANGVPIVAIYMELKDSPVGWMALKERGITKPDQFVGKRIGAWYGTNSEPTFDALMAKLKIDTSKMTRTAMKFDMNPLYTGQVDVMPVYLNGHPLQARRDGKLVTTINPRDYGIRLYGNVYFTTEKMIRERPEVVQKFVNGLAKGWHYTLSQPKDAIEVLLQEEKGLDKGLETEVLEVSGPFFNGGDPLEKLGRMNATRWQETMDVMVTYAGLPKSLELAAAWTNRFVDAVPAAQ